MKNKKCTEELEFFNWQWETCWVKLWLRCDNGKDLLLNSVRPRETDLRREERDYFKRLLLGHMENSVPQTIKNDGKCRSLVLTSLCLRKHIVCSSALFLIGGLRRWKRQCCSKNTWFSLKLCTYHSFLAAELIKWGAKIHPCFSFAQCASFKDYRPLLNNRTVSPSEPVPILSWLLVCFHTAVRGRWKNERISTKQNKPAKASGWTQREVCYTEQTVHLINVHSFHHLF